MWLRAEDFIFFTIYILVFVTYADWLYQKFRQQCLIKTPIIYVFVLATFMLNVVGVVLIRNPYQFMSEPLYHWHLPALLFVQMAFQLPLFNLAIAKIDKHMESKPTVPSKAGFNPVFVMCLMVFCMGILLFYLRGVGMPPFFQFVMNKMNSETVILNRGNYMYLHPLLWLFNLAFSIIPLFIFSYTISGFLKHGSPNKFFLMFIVSFCIFMMLMPGAKGNVLDMMLVCFFCLLINWTQVKTFIFRRRVLMGLGLFVGLIFASTIFMYSRYSINNIEVLAFRIFFRIFAVYTEAISGVITYVNENGYLLGRTLPVIPGLIFKAPRINVDTYLYEYLFLTKVGGLLVPSFAEGYLNFGLAGLIIFTLVLCFILIGIQVLFLRLPHSPFSLSFYALAIFFAFRCAAMSLFATFISKTYLILGLAITLVYFGSQKFSQKLSQLLAKSRRI